MQHTTRQNGRYALLGKTSNGDKVYLERGSYDCDWYFGFGYIAIFEKNKSEWTTHTHWDSYFTGKKHVEPDDVKEKLEETPFSDQELWELCDLMKTFYTLKEASGVYHRDGSSHLTGKTRGTFTGEAVKERIDRDTYKVIVAVQDLLEFDNPTDVKTLPDHVPEGDEDGIE